MTCSITAAKGSNSTGLYTNGAEPGATGSENLSDSGVDLHSGHPMNVSLDYDGTTLQATITDTVTKASVGHSYAVNIPAAVGGPTAYVGFTASTGGLSTVQKVLDWTFTPTATHRSDAPQANTIYVGASRNNQGRELAVLVLAAKDGKLLKTISLGNYAVDQNQIYGERIAQPTFFLGGDRLYVDTHGERWYRSSPAGASSTGASATTHPRRSKVTGTTRSAPQLETSGPIQAGGLLFSKGMRSNRLLGVSTEGPQLEWNRPVAKGSMIVGADDERIYLGGEELTAYSLKTQELLWATQLPVLGGVERAAADEEPALSIHFARRVRS